jgi:serine/threonine-protein kinase
MMADINQSAEIFQRFRREAEITSNLNHPNIVRVFDFDSLPDGRPFLVMELLQGRELSRLIEPDRPLPLAQIVPIIDQIGSGLSAAHERGIVHRDLKPANVFLMALPGKRELVKLLDFGISKVRDGGNRLTRVDSIMGTANYMSPEQANGRTDEADGRNDQFALAAMTYEMLSGRMAFPGDAPLAVLYSVVNEHPVKLNTIVPGLSPAIEEVVARGLSKNRDDRYPSVDDFCRAFVQAAARPVLNRTLVALPSGSVATSDSPAPTPPAPRQRTALLEAFAPSTTLRISTGQVEPGDGARPRRWPRRLAAAGALAAAGILVVAFVSRGGPVVVPLQDESPRPVVNPDVPSSPPPRDENEAKPEPQATITIDIVTSPPEARVVDVRKKTALGVTPVHQQVPRGSGTLEIKIEKSGYEPKSVKLPLDRDFKGAYQLEKRHAIIKL